MQQIKDEAQPFNLNQCVFLSLDIRRRKNIWKINNFLTLHFFFPYLSKPNIFHIFPDFSRVCRNTDNKHIFIYGPFISPHVSSPDSDFKNLTAIRRLKKKSPASIVSKKVGMNLSCGKQQSWGAGGAKWGNMSMSSDLTECFCILE